MIKRIFGESIGRNISSAYKDLIWTVATSSDTSLDIVGQTRLTLKTIEHNLKELGSDKTRIASAQIYISNMNYKSQMDIVWNEWVGDNPQNWPQRACLGVALEGNTLVEITVTAIRC